jgi:hypothetical protein
MIAETPTDKSTHRARRSGQILGESRRAPAPSLLVLHPGAPQRHSQILGGEQDSIDRSFTVLVRVIRRCLPAPTAPCSLAGLLAEFRPCFTASPKPIGFGNCWVVAGIIVQLSFLSRPVCLPVLARPPVGAENSVTSCDPHVLVREAGESIARAGRVIGWLRCIRQFLTGNRRSSQQLTIIGRSRRPVGNADCRPSARRSAPGSTRWSRGRCSADGDGPPGRGRRILSGSAR